MATIQELKDSIKGVVKNTPTPKIRGNALQEKLLEIVDNCYNNSVPTQPQLISGGAVWSGTGYNYNTSEINYFWDGNKSIAPQSFSLDAGGADDRFDVLVIEEDGSLVIVKGTENQSPTLPEYEGILVQFFLVKANSVVPEVVYNVLYNENIEWTVETFAGVNPNSTVSPKFGSKCINYNATETSKIRLNKGSAIDFTGKKSLSFWVRFNSAFPNSFSVTFLNSNGNLTVNTYVNAFLYGANKNVQGVWQLVVIPMSSFSFKQGEVSQMLQLAPTSGTPLAVRNFDIDMVQFIDEEIVEPEIPTEVEIFENGISKGKVAKIDFVDGDNTVTSVVKNGDKIEVKVNAKDTLIDYTTTEKKVPFEKYLGKDVFARIFTDKTAYQNFANQNNTVAIWSNEVKDSTDTTIAYIVRYFYSDVVPPQPQGDFLLQENGDEILQENGDEIIIE